MFVLFVDVLVVVSDVLAVGDVLTLGCYAVFNEPVRQLLQGRDGTAHARRKASCSKSRQQCPGCLTCGSYLIKLSLRLGLYFADLLSLTRKKLKLHMLDLLKTATAVFYQLICRNASLQVLFAFVSNGVVLQPSRATLCERAPARIRWCDRVLPRSPQVVFAAEIGHGRKGPASQQIRAPCYLNGHEGVLRGGCLAVGIRMRCHSLSVNIRLRLISYHLSECGRCPCMPGVH